MFNSECTVYTDHKSLEYIFNSKKTGHAGLRHQRWSIYLQQFTIKVIYVPGKTLEAVEALSRAPIALVLAVRFVVNDWLEAQRVDVFWKFLIDQLSSSQGSTVGVAPDVAQNRVLCNQTPGDFRPLPGGILTTPTGQIVVPLGKRKEILHLYHNHRVGGSHLGRGTSYYHNITSIKSKYFWPKLRTDVVRHIKNCLLCA